MAALAVPAFADAVQWIPDGTEINWPPPALSYEMPTIGYDVNALGILADSLKWSIRAIASKSFWILMLCTLIGCIPDIFHIFFIDQFEIRRGVRRRALNRRIKAEDIKQNHAEIVAEKVRDLELTNEAQQLFRMTNSEKLLTQRVRQMEFNAEASELFKRQNEELLSKRRIADMERNFLDRKQFKRDNRVELMREREFDMKEAASARDLYNLEDRATILRRRLADMETSDNLRNFYRQAKYDEDEEIAQRIRRMELNDRAKDAYREENAETLRERRLREMEASKSICDEFEKSHYDEDADIAQRIRRMELNDRAKDAYRKENAETLRERRLREMETSKSIRDEFEEAHYSEDDAIAKRLRCMEESLKAKGRFHDRNFDEEVEENIQRRLIYHSSEMEYNDRYPENYVEKRAQYQRLAKEYYDLTKYKR